MAVGEIPVKDGARAKPLQLRTVLLTLTTILLNGFGNLTLTWGMRHLPEAVSWNPLGYLKAFLNPFVALGVAQLILWLLTRMTLLSWADLSFVLPVTALGYILAAVLGHVFLNETVTAGHWVGVFLIFFGVAVVGSTSQRTASQ